MSVLFFPYPAVGHVNPMVPVVAELVSRGVRVRVVVAARHGEWVAEVGGEVVRLPVCPDVYVADRFVGLGGLRMVAGWARRVVVACAVLRVLRAEMRDGRPDVVVVDPRMGGADRLVRRRGVPVVLFSTTYAANEHVPGRWPERRSLTWAGGVLRRSVRRWRPIVRRSRGRSILVNAVPELQPARLTFGDGVRFVGPLVRWPGEAGEWQWLGMSRRPVLLVSMGTVFARSASFFRAVVDGFADGGWWVVMATGAVDPVELGRVPDNVVVRRWVPQVAVLQRCTVLLTHAGMNSTLESLAAGVPMVLAPRSGEQTFLARRVAELGVGVRVPSRRFRSEVVRGVVERVAADPGMRAAAAGWRDRISVMPTAQEAANVVLRHAGHDGD